MNLLEKYPHIKPETIKPIRYATDWGTRLFFHPSLFPGILGDTYDALDVIDDNGHLHESVTYEDGKFSHTYLQQHPNIQAWSPTEKVLHGYELEDFYKSCEAIIKFNQAGAVGELKKALTAFYDFKKKTSRTKLIEALASVQDRTQEEELLYNNLLDLAKLKTAPTLDVNDLFHNIIDAYKRILEGNTYTFNSGKFLHVTDVRGMWLNDGDAKVYVIGGELSLDKNFMPYKRSAEKVVFGSLLYTVKHVVENGLDPLVEFTHPVTRTAIQKAFDDNKTEYASKCETIKAFIGRVYGV